MTRAAPIVLVAAALLVLAPRPARAQRADTRAARASLRVYADDDHVTVWSPSASASTPLGERFGVAASVDVDALSAASVDVTSQASPYAFHEQRVEGGLALTWKPGRLTALTGSVIGSTEHDFHSLHLGLALRLELAERNATVDLAYTAAVDEVGRAGDDAAWRDRAGHRLVATFTQILDPRTYLDVVLDGSWQLGYLASPYRYVPIEGAGGLVAFSLPEAVPDARAGVAGLVRVRRALDERWYAHASYRLYADTWSVLSHTATLTAARSFADDRAVLGAELRGYFQDAASFYRAHYDDDGGAPAWRTRDRALGGVRTLSASLALDLAPFGDDPSTRPHLELSATLIRFRWLDFPLQTGRTAALTSVAVAVPF